MPTDIAADEESGMVRIRDRAGMGLPFSKGIMATSILATGIGTSQAYAIATAVRRALLVSELREIDAEDLADLAARLIAEHAGQEAAARYRAWRRAKRAGSPVVLSLAGAPGVGKSTVATRLALRLGIHRVVSSDAIREVLRTVIPESVLPELHVSSFERPECDDAPQEAIFLRQARAVTAASVSVASRMVAEGRSVILEGVHLIPGEVSRSLARLATPAVVVELLLVLRDDERHRAHLLRRQRAEPERGGHRHLGHLGTIRSLQDELERIATAEDVPRFDVAHPEELTQRIVDQVVRESEALQLQS